MAPPSYPATPPLGGVCCIEEQCVCGVDVSYSSIGSIRPLDRFILTRLMIHNSTIPSLTMPCQALPSPCSSSEGLRICSKITKVGKIQAANVSVTTLLYTTMSPESTKTADQRSAPSSSVSLGTLKSTGLYRYQPFSAATAARVLASSRLEPAPSPSLSLPEYTPRTNTGCLLFSPFSLSM